jgi:pimeloyl-ACP methyl ester carboxylesterase
MIKYTHISIMKPYILGLLLILAGAENIYAQIDTLINVGSYTLHFKVFKGKGAPILFESGGALDAGQWDSISRVLHRKLDATIITYDRQGFGKSGLDTLQYNILNEVRGLESAIEQLGYGKSNMLLVSHSLGAFYSRLYANKHPHLIKGIIMLDPRIPSKADVKFAKGIFKNLDRNEFGEEQLGLYYVLAAMERNSDFVRKKHIAATIPILVVMAEEGPFDIKEENDRFKFAQRKFINSRQNTSLVYAKGSAHNIPQDKPELVIFEISKFYRKFLN